MKFFQIIIVIAIAGYGVFGLAGALQADEGSGYLEARSDARVELNEENFGTPIYLDERSPEEKVKIKKEDQNNEDATEADGPAEAQDYNSSRSNKPRPITENGDSNDEAGESDDVDKTDNGKVSEESAVLSQLSAQQISEFIDRLSERLFNMLQQLSATDHNTSRSN